MQTAAGVVVLSGFVDHLLAKERAQQRAERIKGVRGVVNQLVVKPVLRADAEILGDVKQAVLSYTLHTADGSGNRSGHYRGLPVRPVPHEVAAQDGGGIFEPTSHGAPLSPVSFTLQDHPAWT